MLGKGITDRCQNIYNSREHVCIGISPFNSYFSEVRIRSLIEWAAKTFSSFHVFVPDVPSAYTLEALGYAPEKAAHKARRQANCLHNKIYRCLAAVGLTGDKAKEKVLNWKALSENETYLKLWNESKTLYESDPVFRSNCLEASRWVMEKRVPDVDALSENALSLAVQYFLSEIPLFMDVAAIVNKESSVFSYHQTIPFLENLYRGNLPIRSSARQGFFVFDSILDGNQNFTFEQNLASENTSTTYS